MLIIGNDKLSKMFKSTIGVKQGDTLSTFFFNIYIDDLPAFLRSGSSSEMIQIDDSFMNSFLFADDLVILSPSREGLQRTLNKLEEYCKSWHLEINSQKTKVVIFNKQGALIKKHNFFIFEKGIENAKQYKYLGFLFTCSGSMKSGIDGLISQAKKAWFAIKYYLSKSKEKTTKVYLHLFDTLVKPILLYACEVWGDSLTGKAYNIDSIFNNPVEKFHLKVCKEILMIKKTSPNYSTLAELGRFPVRLNIVKQTYKYFNRLISMDQERLLFKLFYDELNIYKESATSWITKFVSLLNKTGYSYIWKNWEDSLKGINVIKTKEISAGKIVLRLKDMYLQAFECLKDNANKKCEGKYDFYSKIKYSYNFEKYLLLKNAKHRSAISKIRLSAHNLAIEAGRWQKKDRSTRICENCKQDTIETEIHFLFSCDKYDIERKTTFEYLKINHCIDFEMQNHTKALKHLFQSDDMKAINIFGKYVHECLVKRNEPSCEDVYFVIFEE